MKARLAELVDFDRLNGGEIRISIGTTDVESGEPVIFDSTGDKIVMDHLLASCGFLPEFAPVEIGDRLLADGGLSVNAPFEPVLEADASRSLLLYVVDLNARDGERPRSLEAALERKSDLTFGNQTILRLRYLLENRQKRAKLSGAEENTRSDTTVLLSYRPGPEEPGPEKSFDLSASALAQRWAAGRFDMEQAELALRNGPGFTSSGARGSRDDCRGSDAPARRTFKYLLTAPPTRTLPHRPVARRVIPMTPASLERSGVLHDCWARAKTNERLTRWTVEML
jgi:NTE family protein